MKLVLLVFIVCLPSDYVRGDTDDAAESGIQSKWAKEPFAAQSGIGSEQSVIPWYISVKWLVYHCLLTNLLQSQQNYQFGKDVITQCRFNSPRYIVCISIICWSKANDFLSWPGYLQRKKNSGRQIRVDKESALPVLSLCANQSLPRTVPRVLELLSIRPKKWM